MVCRQTLAIALAAMALTASAYNRPESTKDFKDLDSDESGHVDRAEVDAHLDKQFDVRPPNPPPEKKSPSRSARPPAEQPRTPPAL